MPSKIIRNAIVCNLCGDEIVSRHVHDFKFCSCKKVAVDGGKEYLRRLGEREHWTDTSVVEE